jgi:hypothetical protein
MPAGAVTRIFGVELRGPIHKKLLPPRSLENLNN